MNILIPHSWLLEHLDTEATPQEIQEKVSLCGPSVERIYDHDGESVYDIEVTTNRVDSMSVRGIAREVAVILEQFGVSAKLKPLNIPAPTKPASGAELPMPKIVNDPELCARITCVILSDIQRTPTPDWMATRLLQIEQQVHDSVIDITNYVTHELGHPCHAFDYDKVMATGGAIIVKEAVAGKKFVTLDGNEYTTVGGEIVFENEAGEIIDLPAVKGTANTSIDDSTKNVLLWIENPDPKKARHASMSHAIRTVAAQLSEKNVDAVLGEWVIHEGARLYQELCHANIASDVYDEFPGKKPFPTVVIRLSTIDNYLGIELPVENIEKILSELECEVSVSPEKVSANNRDKVVISVTPPSFRPDIRIPADIVEEIARIYGYHKLPSVLMETAIPQIKPQDTDFSVENRIKEFLADVGWQEVYTYSLVSEEIAKQSGYSLDDHMRLQNPLTDDRVYLRRSLIPSLVEVLDSNPQHPDLSVFEIANSYQPQDGQLPIEDLHLTMVAQSSYREARGVLEGVLAQFFVKEITINPNDAGTEGEIMIGETIVGTVTVISESRTAFDIKMQDLLPLLKTHPTYIPLPKAEAITEDLTFTLADKTPLGPVVRSISSIDPLVNSVELKDVYNKNHTFAITYLDPNTSLSNELVEPIRKKIVAELKNSWQAELVGSL